MTSRRRLAIRDRAISTRFVRALTPDAVKAQYAALRAIPRYLRDGFKPRERQTLADVIRTYRRFLPR